MKTQPVILEGEHKPKTSRRVRPTAAGSVSWAAGNKGIICKTGLTLGLLFAGFHLLWLGLIWLEWAQPALNFVFWAHMIQPIYVVKPFDPFAAFILIGFTFSTGFTLGSIGAVLWNNLHRIYEQTRY